jgi:uncharacterized protein (TIGR03067 family)
MKEWRMVSAILDGKPLADHMIPFVRRVTVGDETTVYAGGEVLMAFRWKTEYDRYIDYEVIAGPHEGKTQLGIYEETGPDLKICMADPGKDRPSDFASGRGLSLTVWRALHGQS